MEIRQAKSSDWAQIWRIFKKILEEGTTYAFSTSMTEDEAKQVWLDLPQVTYVAIEDGIILGSYYLKPNFQGNASHICNCGYIVSELARGKGVARAMCEHSQKAAIELDFQAMQFNFVVSENYIAVKLWQKLGFKIIGKIPNAFKHPTKGLVDGLIMYKWLAED